MQVWYFVDCLSWGCLMLTPEFSFRWPCTAGIPQGSEHVTECSCQETRVVSLITEDVHSDHLVKVLPALSLLGSCFTFIVYEEYVCSSA